MNFKVKISDRNTLSKMLMQCAISELKRYTDHPPTPPLLSWSAFIGLTWLRTLYIQPFSSRSPISSTFMIS